MIKTLLKTALSATGLLQPIKRLPYLFKTDSIDAYLSTETRGVKHFIVRSFKEYQQYKQSHAARLNHWEQVGKTLLSRHSSSFIIKGQNFLSPNQHAYYRIDISGGPSGKTTNIRESCINLQSELNNRVRATLYAICHSFPSQRLLSSDVYLTESVTPLFNWFKGKSQSLIGSEYIGEHIVSGTVVNGVLHQDITAMSFPNNSFDIGVCLEVLEHIPNYLDALSELARVTRKGGSMFITVPFVEHNEATIVRAELNADGTLVHHLPPEYHGDPVNPNGGILCFRHFGWDFISDLKNSGFADVQTHLVWSAENLIIGQPVIIIEAIK